ncbi:MAG: hypothetical protein K5663_05605 [Clostridiales bacterium]|nr:hypothetical protein [Clostridiales bacterium]
MERKMINDETLELVTGGSIIFNGDCTTCGRKNNAEYKVLNFDAILEYVKANRSKMPEKQMMIHMLELGYITANN